MLYLTTELEEFIATLLVLIEVTLTLAAVMSVMLHTRRGHLDDARRIAVSAGFGFVLTIVGRLSGSLAAPSLAGIAPSALTGIAALAVLAALLLAARPRRARATHGLRRPDLTGRVTDRTPRGARFRYWRS